MSVFSIVGIELIFAETENWKYCSKVIFKCVNSTVRPIFNIFKYMNSACTVREQFMHFLWTINFVSESQHKWL